MSVFLIPIKNKEPVVKLLACCSTSKVRDAKQTECLVKCEKLHLSKSKLAKEVLEDDACAMAAKWDFEKAPDGKILGKTWEQCK